MPLGRSVWRIYLRQFESAGDCAQRRSDPPGGHENTSVTGAHARVTDVPRSTVDVLYCYERNFGRRAGRMVRRLSSESSRGGDSDDGSTTTGEPLPLGDRWPTTLWGLPQVTTFLGHGSRNPAHRLWRGTKKERHDPGSVAAKDMLPVPAFVIDAPDRLIDTSRPRAWWALEDLRPLWRPEVIVAWASATGQPVRDPLGDARLVTPMYEDVPEPAVPLPRRGRGRGSALPEVSAACPIHVRIWTGVLSDEDSPVLLDRTVVLLGTPLDGTAPAHNARNAPAIAEAIVQRGLLTADQARRAYWFALAEGQHAAGPASGSQLLIPPGFAIAARPAGPLRSAHSGIADPGALDRVRHPRGDARPARKPAWVQVAASCLLRRVTSRP